MPKGKKPPSPILRINSGAGNSPDSSRRQSPSYSEFQDFLSRSGTGNDSSRPPSLTEAEQLSEHAWLICAASSAEAKQWEACAGTSTRKRRLTDEVSIDVPPRTRSRLSHTQRPISRSKRNKKNSGENMDSVSNPPSPQQTSDNASRDHNPTVNQPVPPLAQMQPVQSLESRAEEVMVETQHRYEILLRQMQQDMSMQHWILHSQLAQQHQQHTPTPFPVMCCVGGANTHCQLHTLPPSAASHQRHQNAQHQTSSGSGLMPPPPIRRAQTQVNPVTSRHSGVRHVASEPSLTRLVHTASDMPAFVAGPGAVPQQYRNQFFFNPFARQYPIYSNPEGTMAPQSLLFENSESLMQIAERMALLHKPPKGLSKSELEELPCYRFQGAESGEQTACVVCMCDFQQKCMLRVLPCSHHFHAKCIDKWLKTNRTCPICRGDASNTCK